MKTRGIILCLISLGLWLDGSVWGDTVLTRDGRVLRGKIALGENGTVSVADQSVAATNLLRAIFTTNATPAGLSGVTFRLYQGNWRQLPNFATLPIDKSGRLATNRLDLSPLGLQDSQRVFDLQTGQALPRWSAPKIERRPFAISATVVASGADGVIVAQGGNQDGLALYLQDGHLCIALREKGKPIRLLRDEGPLPRYRPIPVLAELRRDLTLRLHVDGREVARDELEDFIQIRPPEGLSVGHDQRPTPVGEYHGENHFQGTLTDVQVRLMGVGLVFECDLHAPAGGNYQFELAADSPVQMKIGGKTILDHGDPAKPKPPRATVKLSAGTHNFRLTYAQLALPKPLTSSQHRREFLTLHWSGPGLARQPLTAVPHPQAVTWHPDDTAVPRPGILTRQGSFLPHPVTVIDRQEVKLDGQALPRAEVSTVILRPISIPEARKLATKPAGILRLDGNYIDGRLLSLDDRKAVLSSVVLGLQNIPRHEQVAAIVLRPAIGPVSRHRFRLRDGTVILAEKYTVKDSQLILDAPAFAGRPIPLAHIAEMSHGKLPNPVQAAAVHWQLHSEVGQQFLATRDTETQNILRAYNDARYQQHTAEKEMLKAEKELAPLLPDEEAATLRHDAANKSYQAVRAAAEPSRKTHEQALQALTNAERKLEADCQKIAPLHEQLMQHIQTRCRPAQRKLFEAQKTVFRETFTNGKKGPSRAAVTRRDTAKRELQQAEAQQAQKAQALLRVVAACQSTADLERRARETEQSAWHRHAPFRTRLAAAEEIYTPILDDYRNKKQAADTIRTILNTAKHRANTARKKIGELAPAYQAIIQP